MELLCPGWRAQGLDSCKERKRLRRGYEAEDQGTEPILLRFMFGSLRLYMWYAGPSNSNPPPGIWEGNRKVEEPGWHRLHFSCFLSCPSVSSLRDSKGGLCSYSIPLLCEPFQVWVVHTSTKADEETVEALLLHVLCTLHLDCLFFTYYYSCAPGF